MRTTYIKDLTLKRQLPYDPNFHGLVDSKLDLGFKVENVDSDSAVFEITVKAEFRTKDTQTEMGKINAVAETKITGFKFPLTTHGNLATESMPENLKRVIEGAVFEDIMLHLSTIARFAHLPSLLPIPVMFPRGEPTAVKRKAIKSDVPKDTSEKS